MGLLCSTLGGAHDDDEGEGTYFIPVTLSLTEVPFFRPDGSDTTTPVLLHFTPPAPVEMSGWEDGLDASTSVQVL